jgi:hypothetical protein
LNTVLRLHHARPRNLICQLYEHYGKWTCTKPARAFCPADPTRPQPSVRRSGGYSPDTRSLLPADVSRGCDQFSPFDIIITRLLLNCTIICGLILEICSDIMDSELDSGAIYGCLPFDQFAIVSPNTRKLSTFAALRTVVGAMGLLLATAAGPRAMELSRSEVVIHESC